MNRSLHWGHVILSPSGCSTAECCGPSVYIGLPQTVSLGTLSYCFKCTTRISTGITLILTRDSAHDAVQSLASSIFGRIRKPVPPVSADYCRAAMGSAGMDVKLPVGLKRRPRPLTGTLPDC